MFCFDAKKTTLPILYDFGRVHFFFAIRFEKNFQICQTFIKSINSFVLKNLNHSLVGTLILAKQFRCTLTISILCYLITKRNLKQVFFRVSKNVFFLKRLFVSGYSFEKKNYSTIQNSKLNAFKTFFSILLTLIGKIRFC